VKQCAGCEHDFDEQFKFCPECGRPFGSDEALAKLNEHLMGMKRSAGQEAALSRRVFSGTGFGDTNLGRVYGT